MRGKSEKLWMRKDDPIAVRMDVRNVPYTAVVGFASMEHGLIHWKMQKQQAFNQYTFIDAVLELQDKFLEQKQQFVLFLDNASIHRSKRVKAICEERGIPLVFNIAYRPDFNGIEGVWGYAKRIYRQAAVSLRLGLDPEVWDNETMVNECLKEVSVATARAMVKHGWNQLMAGRAIVPDRHQGVPMTGLAARKAEWGAHRQPEGVEELESDEDDDVVPDQTEEPPVEEQKNQKNSDAEMADHQQNAADSFMDQIESCAKESFTFAGRRQCRGPKMSQQ